ncbi:hypothetical protein [Bradyrhizobium sp. th.b2]|uniref:hypothetical protein n=1 Tax=Bradyrhizobium sp. th-b2 TaxID=172088 RepID=UPI0012EB1A60|nr:hypothetical protein [Bradyrhizobium sp. th.b2]
MDEGFSEAQDASQLPGFEMLPNGRGISYFGDDGKRIAMVGVGPKDRVFRSEKFGLLNVSKALEAIKREKRRPFRMAINDQLVHHISLVDIDLKYVFEMPEKQSNEPIIMVIASDGANIIDGHHRLKRRIIDKKRDVKVHMLRPDTVRYMQVQVFKENENGKLQLQVGLSKEELDAEIEAGRKMADRILGMNLG